MSRIGKKPVAIASGVTATVKDRQIHVKGPKGELTMSVPTGIDVQVQGSQLTVTRQGDDKQSKANHGTVRNLIANMLVGVTQGYSKDLEIQGVGFRANLQGRKLVMSLGYSHPVEYEVPEGVKVNVTDGTAISVAGVDKQLVGQVSARIRAFCPPEPYKGKGVRLKGEYVRRKVGKTVA